MLLQVADSTEHDVCTLEVTSNDAGIEVTWRWIDPSVDRADVLRQFERATALGAIGFSGPPVEATSLEMSVCWLTDFRDVDPGRVVEEVRTDRLSWGRGMHLNRHGTILVPIDDLLDRARTAVRRAIIE